MGVTMAKSYMLIASRDPFTSNDVKRCYELAASFARKGNQVTLFMIQNGVFAARRGPESSRLQELSKAGVRVLADEFSLRERGIAQTRLADGVGAAPLDAVMDALANGVNTIWN